MTIGAPPTRSPIVKNKTQDARNVLLPMPAIAQKNKDGSEINAEWQQFFSDVFKAIQALQQSGTTAQRPTKGLYVGRPYFDTSLGAKGKPIWVDKDGTGWVLADGTVA